MSLRRKRLRTRLLPLAVASISFGAIASAPLPAFADGVDDFVRESIPQKWIQPLLAEDLPALTHPAYFDEVDKAEAESFAGRYRKALMLLRKLKPEEIKPEKMETVALIRARSLAALGRWDEALAASTDPAVAEKPALQLEYIKVLAATGRTDEAMQALRKHLDAHPKSIPGRYLLGKLSEQIGDLETASGPDAYGWFIAEPQNFLVNWGARTKHREFESAENVTYIGRSIDRWAALSGAYRENAKLHEAILDMFVKAYDVIGAGYWPAQVAAGEYLMWHDQREEAGKELTEALKLNPNSIEALNLIGSLHVEVWNFDAADAAVASIRKVNPSSVEANLLEARNLLQQRRAQEAETPISTVLTQQPKHIEAMGLLAAVYALQLQEEKASEILRRVEAVDPDNATAYVEVAEQLGAMRQYPRSADKYKVAIERAPWWMAARNGLGLLYTQSGEEDDARLVLSEARKLDPFNRATTNYMRLLDEMAGYAKKETDHFIVMYDPQQDPVIPEYFADYMESVHAQICNTFQHAPAVKTIIEVFPGHDQFSVRTTGSPWIGTVGASTGRIIALKSPRGGDQMGTFNWAQVLRHEYTHTVTLSATDNRIAHWMTEGLAVVEERTPMRWEWVPMLFRAVKTKELFSMEDLTWAFVRPKKPHHRTLAYAESAWVCQYIEEKWGREAILKMLTEFRNAGRQEDVFPKVLGTPIPEFEKDFFAWCELQTSKWGYDEETTKKYDDLKEKAEAMVKGKQFAEAAAAWEELAKLRPVDALPHRRLAGLYLTKQVNDPQKAIGHLEALNKVELKDNRYAKRIAGLYRDLGESEKAQQSALTAVYIDPYDLSAHQLLAEVYEKAGNQEGLEREKRVIPVLQKWIATQKGTADAPVPSGGAGL